MASKQAKKKRVKTGGRGVAKIAFGGIAALVGLNANLDIDSGQQAFLDQNTGVDGKAYTQVLSRDQVRAPIAFEGDGLRIGNVTIGLGGQAAHAQPQVFPGFGQPPVLPPVVTGTPIGFPVTGGQVTVLPPGVNTGGPVVIGGTTIQEQCTGVCTGSIGPDVDWVSVGGRIILIELTKGALGALLEDRERVDGTHDDGTMRLERNLERTLGTEVTLAGLSEPQLQWISARLQSIFTAGQFQQLTGPDFFTPDFSAFLTGQGITLPAPDNSLSGTPDITSFVTDAPLAAPAEGEITVFGSRPGAITAESLGLQIGRTTGGSLQLVSVDGAAAIRDAAAPAGSGDAVVRVANTAPHDQVLEAMLGYGRDSIPYLLDNTDDFWRGLDATGANAFRLDGSALVRLGSNTAAGLDEWQSNLDTNVQFIGPQIRTVTLMTTGDRLIGRFTPETFAQWQEAVDARRAASGPAQPIRYFVNNESGIVRVSYNGTAQEGERALPEEFYIGAYRNIAAGEYGGQFVFFVGSSRDGTKFERLTVAPTALTPVIAVSPQAGAELDAPPAVNLETLTEPPPLVSGVRRAAPPAPERVEAPPPAPVTFENAERVDGSDCWITLYLSNGTRYVRLTPARIVAGAQTFEWAVYTGEGVPSNSTSNDQVRILETNGNGTVHPDVLAREFGLTGRGRTSEARELRDAAVAKRMEGIDCDTVTGCQANAAADAAAAELANRQMIDRLASGGSTLGVTQDGLLTTRDDPRAVAQISVTEAEAAAGQRKAAGTEFLTTDRGFAGWGLFGQQERNFQLREAPAPGIEEHAQVTAAAETQNRNNIGTMLILVIVAASGLALQRFHFAPRRRTAEEEEKNANVTYTPQNQEFGPEAKNSVDAVSSYATATAVTLSAAVGSLAGAVAFMAAPVLVPVAAAIGVVAGGIGGAVHVAREREAYLQKTKDYAALQRDVTRRFNAFNDAINPKTATSAEDKIIAITDMMQIGAFKPSKSFAGSEYWQILQRAAYSHDESACRDAAEDLVNIFKGYNPDGTSRGNSDPHHGEMLIGALARSLRPEGKVVRRVAEYLLRLKPAA